MTQDPQWPALWAWAAPDPPPTLPRRVAQGAYVGVPTVLWYVYQELPRYAGAPKFWWPELVPTAEYADFSYDATNDVPPGDEIVGLSISVAPSGPGEVAPSRLELTPPGLVTVWLTGGRPGRVYVYEMIITTREIRALPIIIGQRCRAPLTYPPLPPPANPNFGNSVSWP